MSLNSEAWEAVLPRHSGVLPRTFLKNHCIKSAKIEAEDNEEDDEEPAEEASAQGPTQQ